MKIKLRIGAFLLAMLMLLSALSGCAGFANPLGYLKDSAEKTLKNALLGELLSLVLDVADKGKITVEFGGTDLVQDLPDAADLSLWLDAQSRKVVADGEMTLSGEKYDLAAYLNETEAVVVSSAFFGSNTLGVDFLTLKDDLKTSIFSNNSGTSFSNPDVSAASADRIQQIKKSFFKLLAYNEKTLDFADEVMDVFLSELTAYAENSRYKKDGYTHITLSVNNDSLARTLRATRAALVKDRSFGKYLNDLAATLDAMVSATTGITTTEYTTKVKYFLTSEADIDAICARIDNAEPFVFELKAAIKSFGMSLKDASLSFSQSGVTRVTAALHLDAEQISTLDVTVDGVARSFGYRVVEDAFRNYRAELTYTKSVAGTTVTQVKGDLAANKRDKTYALTLTRGSDTRVFGGKYDFGGDAILIAEIRVDEFSNPAAGVFDLSSNAAAEPVDA